MIPIIRYSLLKVHKYTPQGTSMYLCLRDVLCVFSIYVVLSIVNKMTEISPPFKNKPYHGMKRLFVKKNGGFLAKDLRNIITNDRFYKLLQDTRITASTPFIWQVEQFPYFEVDFVQRFDEFADEPENMIDTVLATAKNSGFCAVLSMTRQQQIWYRLYENDGTSERLGTLRYAYLQDFFLDHQRSFETGQKTPIIDTIFVFFNKHVQYPLFSLDGDLMEDHTFKTISAECKSYNHLDDQLQIKSVLIQDTGETNSVTFEDSNSEDYFENNAAVSGYLCFLDFRPDKRESDWLPRPNKFLDDSHRRPIGL